MSIVVLLQFKNRTFVSVFLFTNVCKGACKQVSWFFMFSYWGGGALQVSHACGLCIGVYTLCRSCGGHSLYHMSVGYV